MLVSFLAYSTLKMEATCSSETSALYPIRCTHFIWLHKSFPPDNATDRPERRMSQQDVSPSTPAPAPTPGGHVNRNLCYFSGFSALGRGHTKETGNRNATAISEKCYQNVELNWAAKTVEAAMRFQCNSWKTKKLNSQATEKASLITVALPRSFLVPAVLTCFCDVFASLDDMGGWWSC
jgi:hypothetical protein